MTTVQVAAAKAKNWNPKYFDGKRWLDYEGVDPGIAIDEDNFPDDRFRNWLLAQDYGKDEYLSSAEISEVLSIDVSSKGITSLQGIEFFTALRGLRCYDNRLTELDLSGNPDVQLLYCYGNSIRGKNMTKLIESLASFSQPTGILYGIAVDELPTGNVITLSQVKVAKDKGWAVFDNQTNYYDGAAGDANGDDDIDETDIDSLRDYILSLNATGFDEGAADMNGDGVVDIVDLTLLIEKIKD